jgi:hypothetical protein
MGQESNDAPLTRRRIETCAREVRSPPEFAFVYIFGSGLISFIHSASTRRNRHFISPKTQAPPKASTYVDSIAFCDLNYRRWALLVTLATGVHL